MRRRPDVVAFGCQTFVVGKVRQYNLPQQLCLFVGIVADNRTVIIDLITHQIARFVAILGGCHNIVSAGILLHGVEEAQAKRGGICAVNCASGNILCWI
ncbi:Uncharacterised protein [Shigella sonnei]|nr:Uncharacterised protein [Shigella sonnei]